MIYNIIVKSSETIENIIKNLKRICLKLLSHHTFELEFEGNRRYIGAI